MALNLSRNTKVYFSTNTATTGFTAANTFELQVMDGYSLNQNTDAQTIQLNEAGAAPSRGQRSFNTALQPVEWEISTYIRPRKASSIATCDERFLWNALAGAQAIGVVGTQKAITSAAKTGTTGTYTSTAHGFVVGDYVAVAGYTAGEAEWNGHFYVMATAANTFSVDFTDVRNAMPDLNATATTGPVATTAVQTAAAATKGQWGESTAFAMGAFAASNVHQLQAFTLIFKIDNTYYRVVSSAIDSATIDFGIDQIAQVRWAGRGTQLLELTGAGTTEIATSAVAPTTSANFITNKLSTLTFKKGIKGNSTTYSIPITGGSLTIANNLSYLTPALLGTVNTPVGYFTGTRAISGNLTAYLRTGTTEAGGVLADLLANASSSIEPKYQIQVELGGLTNSTRVDFLMNSAMLQIPAVDVQDVVSTTINFTAQGADDGTQNYNIEKKNELFVRYYSA